MASITTIGETVPVFRLHIMDGKEVEVEIEATNSHEAIETGVTALAQFVCKHFPPPENLQVHISDETGRSVGTVSFAFNIKIAPGVAN